jgi:uncharacterized membrane protein
LIGGAPLWVRRSSFLTGLGRVACFFKLYSGTMAELHPQVVHFTIALAFLGVGFRLISLLGRPLFAGPTAAVLLILAALFGFIATQSGTAAHGPVERAPGARPVVVAHEVWGERARNVLLLVGVIELVGLVLVRSPRARIARIAAASLGVIALFCVYEAAEHGGELVYSYAGGVGIRSGDPKDVERLLLAGLYHQSLQDRKAGYRDQAAELVTLAARRFPGDTEVRLLAAESLLIDQRNVQGAIDALAAVEVPADNRVLRTRRAMLQADAFEAAGQKDAAIAVLQPLVEAFPNNARLKERLDTLRGAGAAPQR